MTGAIPKKTIIAEMVEPSILFLNLFDAMWVFKTWELLDKNQLVNLKILEASNNNNRIFYIKLIGTFQLTSAKVGANDFVLNLVSHSHQNLVYGEHSSVS